jgi:putative ABC transport system permease protein
VVRSHPTLRRKLLRDMRRQWPLFISVTVTVAVGVAFFTAAFGAYRNMTSSYAGVFNTERVADLWVTGGDVEAFVIAASHDPAVDVAATRTQADLPMSVGAEKMQGRIVGIPTAAVGKTTLLSGHDPTNDGQVLVEHHLADHFRLRSGDAVSILGPHGWQQLTITGVVSSAEYLWPARDRQEVFPLPDNFGVLFTPNAIASRISGTSDNQALIRLHNGRDAAALDRLRSQAFAHGAIDVIDRAQQPSNSLLSIDLNGLRSLAYVFPVLFLTVAALMTYVLLSRRVRSERPVIGVLIAGGVPHRVLLWHYLQFGMLAGAFGAAAGVITGAAGSIALTRIYIRFISLPESAAVIRLKPTTVLIGFAFGVIVGMIAAAAPAILAFRTPPAAAMRGTTPLERGRPSIIERLLPPLGRLPVRWLLVFRNVGRNRLRTSCTIAGTVLSLLLLLVSWLGIDSMNAIFRTQFGKVQLADARVNYTEPVDQRTLTELAAIPGVGAVEPSVEMPVTLNGNGRTYSTTLFGLRADTTMHGFQRSDGTPTHLSDQGLLIGSGIRDQLGIASGDRVTVAFAGQPPLTASVVGLLDERIGTFAYAPIGWIEAASGHPLKATSALLRLKPDADHQTIRATIMKPPNVASYEDMAELQHVIKQYAGLFFALYGAMLILGGLMAFAIIFTTMSVNIVERRREIATLRGGGMRHPVVARLITSENLLVTLFGLIPGVVLGVFVAQGFMKLYTNDQLRLHLVVQPTTLLASAAAVILAAALSQWPGLRAIRNLDLAAVARERTD